MIRKILLILIIIHQYVYCAGQVMLTDSSDEYHFNAATKVFEDKNQQYNIDQIVSAVFADSFKTRENDFINNPNSDYWIKLPIYNRCKNKLWLLELTDFQLGHVTIYDGSAPLSPALGYAEPFANRLYPHKNFVIQLPPYPFRKTYYLKVNSPYRTYANGNIKTAQKFAAYSLQEYVFLGFFYGALVALLIYNIFLYFSTRFKPLFYYIPYLISVSFVTTSRDGLGFQFLWPNHPEINLYIQPIAYLLTTCFGGFYSIVFLNLRRISHGFYRLILIVITVRILLFILFFIVSPQYLYFQWIDLLPMIVYLAAGISSYRKGFKPARLYVAAMVFLLLSFTEVLLIFYSSGTFTLGLIVFYIFNLAVLAEILFLSASINSSIRHIVIEKEEAQQETIRQMAEKELLKDKVNRELEDKVAQRTTELHTKAQQLAEANTKLEHMAAQLNEMNRKLDVENWQLNTQVKEKTKAIIQAELLSFEEFSKVYPDEAACMRHLEELKWEHGFNCVKCGYDKWSETAKIFNRKCNRCGHIHSPTSDTIFHALRFPLNKAFYIVYLTAVAEKKITLQQISDTIDLRLNTCSDFRKKVKLRSEVLLKKIGKSKVDKWQDLILDSKTR